MRGRKQRKIAMNWKRMFFNDLEIKVIKVIEGLLGKGSVRFGDTSFCTNL